ncbi:MAG TPA: hypothetical protein DEB05_06730 [Firmicutes bacterium]|nr:hypothetical protein [Bacillota bacterium]
MFSRFSLVPFWGFYFTHFSVEFILKLSLTDLEFSFANLEMFKGFSGKVRSVLKSSKIHKHKEEEFFVFRRIKNIFVSPVNL